MTIQISNFSLWRLSFAALLVGVVTVAGTAQALILTGTPLVEALRHGGYVLVMRHGSSPASTPTADTAAPDNIRLERQLDEAGQKGAHAMGEAIKTLHIPIGDVLSSPTYRALETVRLASLPPPKIFDELGDGGISMRAANGAQATWLQRKAAERPRTNTNTFIVTHFPNITSAFGEDATNLAEGEVLVFRPDGKGGAKLVGRIKIEEWPSLATRQ
jgi:phosphohistidine phosphatase SixA